MEENVSRAMGQNSLTPWGKQTGNNNLNLRLSRDQSSWCQKALEVGQRFSLEKAFIIQQEQWFIILRKDISD